MGDLLYYINKDDIQIFFNQKKKMGKLQKSPYSVKIVLRELDAK